MMVPSFYPVDLESIERLERVAHVNPELKDFWLKKGHGFFNEDENGNFIDNGVMNVLFAPEQVLYFLENATEDDHLDYEKGLPFFDGGDLTLFLLTPDGRVICLSRGFEVEIAPSFDLFFKRLHEDCAFHEHLW